jgi:hypothetical protein
METLIYLAAVCLSSVGVAYYLLHRKPRAPVRITPKVAAVALAATKEPTMGTFQEYSAAILKDAKDALANAEAFVAPAVSEIETVAKSEYDALRADYEAGLKNLDELKDTVAALVAKLAPKAADAALVAKLAPKAADAAKVITGTVGAQVNFTSEPSERPVEGVTEVKSAGAAGAG